ncbi:hypothetical protein AB0B18_24235 [Micromonospora chalcea]
MAEEEQVFGFHRVFEGPSVRIATGSLLALPGRVASTHELAHQSLTESTSFGQLMTLCAVLEHTAPERPGNLHRLAGQCRTVHESLATFASVWMAADGDLSVLAGSREYLSWYKDAAEAVPFADHSRLKLLALQGIAHACMNGPVLQGLVRLGANDPAAWQVAVTDRPDRRLALFHRGVPADFWPETWQGCRDLLGEEAWPVFVPPVPSAAALTETFREEFDPLVSRVAVYLDERFEKLLEQRGARTVESSGEEFSQAAESVEAAAPIIRGRIRVTSDLSLTERRLEQLFGERILLSDEPRPARLLVLADHLDLPLVQAGDKRRPPFIYVIVRCASRLLDQFAFPENEHEWLATLGNETLTLIVARARGGEWLLLKVQEPEEMASLASLLNGRAEIHVNWSMASMAEAVKEDADASGVPLATAVRALELGDFSLALLDFPIIGAIRGWVTQRLPIRYSSGIVRVNGSDKLHLVTMRFPGREDLMIVLCGGHQERALRLFLDDDYPDATWDPDLLSEEAQEAALRTVPLLLDSEHVIDYRALLMTRRMT